MLIYDILPAVTVSNDNIAVKSLYKPTELKAVDQKECYRDLLPACLIEKNILQVKILVHFVCPFLKALRLGAKLISFYSVQ